MIDREARVPRRRRRDDGAGPSAVQRRINYRKLVNPLVRQPAFTDDRIAAIHETALRVVEELGIKVLNEEARRLFKSGGATVDEASLDGPHRSRARCSKRCASAPSQFDLLGAERRRSMSRLAAITSPSSASAGRRIFPISIAASATARSKTRATSSSSTSISTSSICSRRMSSRRMFRSTSGICRRPKAN